MKALYFRRHCEHPVSEWLNLAEDSIFFPDKNVIIGKSSNGNYGLTRDKDLLDEANFLLQGTPKTIEGVSYSDVAAFDIEEETAQKLIKSIDAICTLKKATKSAFKDISDKALAPLRKKQYEERLASYAPKERARVIKRDQTRERTCAYVEKHLASLQKKYDGKWVYVNAYKKPVTIITAPTEEALFSIIGKQPAVSLIFNILNFTKKQGAEHSD